MSAQFLRAWRGGRSFLQNSRAAQPLVFYAEDAGSWCYYEPVIRELLSGDLSSGDSPPLAYLTSAADDPILDAPPDGLVPHYIGASSVRTYVFMAMHARAVVLTMPALDTSYITRSKTSAPRYIYLFHSLVSSHMAYRESAFHHYDAVLCAGPHHQAEIRAAEVLHGLPAKQLVQAGYPYLDSLLAPRPVFPARRLASQQTVLVAPSWGAHGLLETCGSHLLETLLKAGYRVVLRPHPMSWRNSPEIVRSLAARFRGHARFTIDRSVCNRALLEDADHLISDWSGIAFEYAFSRERPVLFIDTPRKVNNLAYQRLGLPPVEIELRREIGALLPHTRLPEVPRLLRKLGNESLAYAGHIRAARAQTVFALGRSAAASASAILDIARGSAKPGVEAPPPKASRRTAGS